MAHAPLSLVCPELAALMDGVLAGQLSDQATAQEAIAVITQFASQGELDIGKISKTETYHSAAKPGPSQPPPDVPATDVHAVVPILLRPEDLDTRSSPYRAKSRQCCKPAVV